MRGSFQQFGLYKICECGGGVEYEDCNRSFFNSYSNYFGMYIVFVNN